MRVCKLHYYMNTRGINLQELSKGVDINVGTLSKYATGKVYPNVFTAIKIAEFLGARIDDIWYEF